MAQWPAGLPQQPFTGTLQEVDEENLDSFKPSTGPSLDNPRSSAAGTIFEFELRITTAQKEALRTFHRTTLSFGALSFTAPRPGDENDIITVKFLAPPQYTHLAGDMHAAALRWYLIPT